MLPFLLRSFGNERAKVYRAAASAVNSPMSRLPRMLNPAVVLGATTLTCTYFAYVWVMDDGKAPEPYPKTIEGKVYRHLPTNAYSHFVGLISRVNIPESLRRFVLGGYVRLAGCNMEEAVESDVTKYTTLSQLFMRQLKPECRPIDKTALITSPADGTVVYIGPVDKHSGLLNQVKDVTYSLKEFLGPIEPFVSKEKDTELYQCTIYLSPGDCHNFYNPVDWSVKIRRHFPGRLISVRPSFTKHIPGLFAVNERVAYLGDWRYGFMSLTAVGAAGVGSLMVDFDPTLAMNRPPLATNTLRTVIPSFKNRDCTPEEIALGTLKNKMGSSFGRFKLGSTIVLVFEAPKSKILWNVKSGDRIQYGKPILAANN